MRTGPLGVGWGGRGTWEVQSRSKSGTVSSFGSQVCGKLKEDKLVPTLLSAIQ